MNVVTKIAAVFFRLQKSRSPLARILNATHERKIGFGRYGSPLILLSVVLLFILGTSHHTGTIFVWQSEAFHSTTEALGFLAALLLSFIILKTARVGNMEFLYYIAIGLLAMCVFDCIHAFFRPNECSIWAQHFSILIGGTFFSFVWFPEPKKKYTTRKILPFITLMGSILSGAAIFIIQDNTPSWIDIKQYLILSRLMNCIGGSLFISAALKFLLDFNKTERTISGMLCILSFLFGISGFALCNIRSGEDSFWFYHLLRLAAYLLAIYIWFELFISHIKRLEDLIIEEKKLRRDLSVEKIKFESITNHLGAGVAVISRDFRLVWVNKVFQSVFGEVEGKECFRTINQREDICPGCGVQQIFEKGLDHVIHEQVGRDLNENTTWSEIIATPLKDDDGKVVEVLELVIPITDRKNAEEALRESEEKFRRLSDAAEEGIAIHENGVILEANEAFCRMFGYDLTELSGRSAENLLVPETWEIVKANINKDFTAPYEGIGIRQNGSNFPIYLVGKPFVWGNKKYRVAVLKDISQKKRLNERLQLLEKAIETTQVGITISDVTGIILYLNPAEAQMHGYERSELIEKDIGIFAKPEQRKPLMEKQLEQLEFWTRESINIRKNGSEFPVNLTSSTVYNESKKAIGKVTICENITGRKIAEKKLLDYQSQLRSLALKLSLSKEHERRTIAVGIHDNIGPMLAYLKMKLCALKDDVVEDRIRQELEEAKSRVGDLIGLTRSLIFELSPPVLYDSGLEEAIKWLIRESLKQSKVELIYNKASSIKPLNSDIQIALYQSVRELLINVVKHAQAESTTINVDHRPDSIKISIQDNGQGFIENNQLMRERAGGFGLFSIRERILQLDGIFKIESSPGEGTKAIIALPLQSNTQM